MFFFLRRSLGDVWQRERDVLRLLRVQRREYEPELGERFVSEREALDVSPVRDRQSNQSSLSVRIFPFSCPPIVLECSHIETEKEREKKLDLFPFYFLFHVRIHLSSFRLAAATTLTSYDISVVVLAANRKARSQSLKSTRSR